MTGGAAPPPDAQILVVEDNPDDADLIAHAFRRAGLSARLHFVADGEAALAYLGRGADAAEGRPPLPRVVLLDLKLPRLSGFDVLTRVRADPATRPVPVVILTSSDQDEDIRRAYGLGANSYLVKPVRRDALTEMMRSLDQYWLRYNHTAH